MHRIFSGLDNNGWNVDSTTGLLSLTNAARETLINPDPIEKWYIIDTEPIARGQFTVVYHCLHRVTGEEFAAKYSSRWRLGVDCTADVEHEIAVCAVLRRADMIVEMVDVFCTPTEMILVMEYAPGGDLQSFLDKDMVPYEKHVKEFLRSVLRSLIFIHDRNIVHLDIKPQNLVMVGDYPDGAVKLCDFEISRMLTSGSDIREVLGTADYVAPEIIHYDTITTKTDMWSFGVLTYVLLTGFLPFGGDSDSITFLEISKAELDFPNELFEDISELAIDFIKRLLIKQPHLRMSAKECMNHEWLKYGIPAMESPSRDLIEFRDLPNSTENQLLPLRNSFSFNETSNLNGNQNPRRVMVYSEPGDSMDTSPDGKSLDEFLNANIMDSKPRNIRDGLPPLYPQISNRSNQSIHSSTSSLNKGSSRQSLDRVRSMSKSREILVEKLQLTSQKKMMSRSRERLFDGRFGLHRSREALLDHTPFSQSFETLTDGDNSDSIYCSNNSICVLPILSLLPLVEENNNNKHYGSLASITQSEREFKNDKNSSKRKDSDSSHYSLDISRDINKNVGYIPKDTRKTTGKNSSYIQESYPKIGKGLSTFTGTKSNCSRIRKSTSSPAVNKQTKLNQHIHKLNEKNQMKHFNSDPKLCKKESSEAPKSILDQRRGSASRIEQRIQKRHERMERKESQQEYEKKVKRKSGVVNTKKTKINTKKSSSNAPERSKLNNNTSSDSSSMESVKEAPHIKQKTSTSKKKNNERSPKTSLTKTQKTTTSISKKMSYDSELDHIKTKEDAPYGGFMRSNSMDSTNSTSTVKDLEVLDDETCLQTLEIKDTVPLKTTEESEVKPTTKPTESKDKDDTVDALTVITEEEEESSSLLYVRSISTCSDVSSSISELSGNDECTKNRKQSEVDTTRGRSMSIQPTKNVFSTNILSRSSSVHFDLPDKARPWGEVCNGSVDRAFHLFSQKSCEFIFTPRKHSDPTSDRISKHNPKRNTIISLKH